MAEILTQRALVLAEIEVTFGVDPIPDPTTDAFLVADPDFSVDITEIIRNFARNSLSPLPVAAGRKIASMTFVHEVRSNGSFDGSTPPRLGVLLRACGFAETAITTNGTTNGRTDVTADVGNTGAAVTFAAGGTNSIIRAGDYRIRVTLGGASATVEARVSGGYFPEDQIVDAAQDEDRIFTETFCVELITSVGTVTGAVTVDDSTDPQSPVYDFTGLAGLTVGDVWRTTIAGVRFTVTATGATPTTLAADIEAAVDAHTDITSTSAAGVLTIDTLTGPFASTVLTTAVTSLPLGASGHSVIGTFGAPLDLNDSFSAVTKPTGTEYDPISTGFESVTIHMFFDGILHRMTASRGTFNVEGTGGELANFNFEFTGNFEVVTDVAIPSAIFETQIPVQVELAELVVNQDVDATAPAVQVPAADVFPVCDTYEDQINGSINSLCAASFNFDLANDVVIRECINEADAFKGVIITGREPVGSIDPELELVATHDFWGILSTADVLGWHVKVGTLRGNIVRFDSDSVQYNGLSYADRDGLRVLEVDLRFSGSAPAFEDDEIRIAFY